MPSTDPKCRFAQRDAEHRCTNRDGQALRPRSACFVEASMQIVEAALERRRQRERDRAACEELQRQFNEATAMPCTSCGGDLADFDSGGIYYAAAQPGDTDGPRCGGCLAEESDEWGRPAFVGRAL